MLFCIYAKKRKRKGKAANNKKHKSNYIYRLMGLPTNNNPRETRRAW
jgi:hypothetical protein